jgi:ornithine decarboxylase
MVIYDAKPVFPMTAEQHLAWRKQLWGRRGPNMADNENILPCYTHALQRSGDESPKSPSVPASPILSRQPSCAATLPIAATRYQILECMLAGIAGGQEEPFFVVDLGTALGKLSQWHEHLPGIEPHYAVKCNGDPALLLTLAHAGVGFDCASQAEIDAVLGLGVSPSHIVYANPIKQPSHLRFAAQRGVGLTVFDGEAELHKLAACHPTCELLLRLAVDDSHAQCILSNKYGAAPSDAAHLLGVAHSLNLHVVGVSFHVGSGSSDADPFGDAVRRAAGVFALAEQAGRPMTILDVGGGFPGVDEPGSPTFAEMAKSLRDALAIHFPPSRGVKLIAEPGRFFACSTHTLTASIIGRKSFAPRQQQQQQQQQQPPPPPPPATKVAAAAAPDVSDGGGSAAAGTGNAHLAKSVAATAADTGRVMYYINDGLYGSFNCVLYDHAAPEVDIVPTPEVAQLLRGPPAPAGEALACSVWGPTCDGIDCVIADAKLPSELPVGSWLLFPDMGAYTSCAGSNFNGMALPDVSYLQASGEHSRPMPPQKAAAAMLEQLRRSGVTAKPPAAAATAVA